MAGLGTRKLSVLPARVGDMSTPEAADEASVLLRAVAEVEDLVADLVGGDLASGNVARLDTQGPVQADAHEGGCADRVGALTASRRGRRTS